MNQGDVRWYEFRAPDKRRPVVVLTRDSVIRHLNAVVVAPITTTIRESASQVRLSMEDGMHEECVINLDNLQAVPKTRLGPTISRLSGTRMRQVKAGIAYALGFSQIDELP